MYINWHKAKTLIKKDGIVVAPSDTIFGIFGSALSKKVVARIYKIKGRDEHKPFIILISDLQQLILFGVTTVASVASYFKPKTSIIVPVPNAKFAYLHRGTKSLAFRLVGRRNKHLHMLIQSVGPIVAPSANPQGFPPAHTAKEAQAYFGGQIDAYIVGYPKPTKPSTIVSLVSGKPEVLRK